jgi:hypothetical protein
MNGRRLHRPHEYDGTLGQHPRQCYVFSSMSVPTQFRPLYKEDLVFISARYFHCCGLRQRLRLRIDHPSPPQSKEQFIGHQPRGKPAKHQHLYSTHPAVCAG